MQVMRGQVPAISTFGIMSADNPMNQTLTAEENNKRRTQFKEYMRRHALYGYVQHSGKYGGPMEKSFFIPNIRREALLSLGRQFDQESVIFGSMDKENQKVTFQLIMGETVEAEREVVLQLKDDQEDFFSIHKGRKFFIPFFDEDYAPERKLSYMKEDFPDKAEHLAVLENEMEWIRQDAAGKTSGMAVLAHRHRVRNALRTLKVIE
jgi:hypothetical protein